MTYSRNGDVVVIRLHHGDDIHRSLLEVAALEKFTSASVSAIGALEAFSLGMFLPDKREYHRKDYTGDFELLSLTGNVTTLDGKPFAHLHAVLSDATYAAIGGHLFEGKTGATVEMVVHILPIKIDRKEDPRTGLNLMVFGE